MLSLCLAVLSTALISIIMRLSTGRITHNLGMLTMNYIVCTLLSGLFGGWQDALSLADPLIGLVLVMGTSPMILMILIG